MPRLRIALGVCVAALLLTSTASGYYHFIHFANRAAPYVPVPEKYDINALRNKTIYYFISEQGPSQLATGDSFAGLVSQIRLAAKTWSDVPGSDLRIAFGGLSSPFTPQNGPGIDVVFADDIPPGVWAMGGVTSVSAAVTPAMGGSFVPITRGVVRMPRDMGQSPSFTERGFLVLLHELGHALGLQHTFTSGTMSTEITRATTRARPLSDDDVAAISVLYPAGSFLSQTASVAGRVTAGGAGVNLASVVAISASGAAISALTNPDGTYAMQGIPAGPYLLYAHPLPTALNGESSPGAVVPPKGPDGFSFAATDAFETQFYPGTRDPGAASQLVLNPGEARTGLNFAVQRKTSPDVSSVTTYGYYGSVAVSPAPLVGNTNGAVLVARGTGLVTAGNALAPGLSVRALADSGVTVEPTSVKYYTNGYIRFDVYPGFGWTPGARHLVFSTRDDVYVLPASLLLVPNRGPVISSVRAAVDDRGNRTVPITGTNLDGATRFFFDGVQAPVARAAADGSFVVAPPPGPGGHRANVVALNADGQSSLFAQPDGGPAYSYDFADAPVISIVPAALPAGSEAMVEITGINTAFADGHTVLGFGTSDVAVRKAWVVGPNRIVANIAISAAAQPSASNVTVISGLQIAALPLAFQIGPLPNPRPVGIVPPATNPLTGAASVAPGGTGILTVTNLNASASTLALTIGEQRATILAANQGQITFQVPLGVPPGPAIVRLQTQSGDAVLPVLIDIEVPAPAIVAAYSSPGVVVDPFRPAIRGTVFALLVAGLTDAAAAGDPASVKVNVGGVEHSAVSVAAQSGGFLVQISLSNSVPPGPQTPVFVAYNGLASTPVAVAVR